MSDGSELSEDDDFDIRFSTDDDNNLPAPDDPDDAPRESDAAKQQRLKEELQTWAIMFAIRHRALHALLAILAEHLPFLPTDPRTLKGTLRKIDLHKVAGGDYTYSSLKQGVLNYLKKFASKLSSTILNIRINIDGIPLYNSKGIQAWPILCSINYCRPFVVALWTGMSKPLCAFKYLKDFITEFKDCRANGITSGEKTYRFHVPVWICDAPSAPFKGHSGTYGIWQLWKMRREGRATRGAVRLVGTRARKRTNQGFANKQYVDHQRHSTPLTDKDLGLKLVSHFTLDYMHLVCLGVVRRLLYKFRKGPRTIRISAASMNAISAALTAMKDHVPSAFQRRPRSLQELDRWSHGIQVLFTVWWACCIEKYCW